MRAVITGASSGIGRDFAKVLHEKGYKLTLIARRYDRLCELKEKYGDDTQIILADLSEKDNILKAVSEIDMSDAEILINNAGFGLCGDFSETDMERELEMIDVNVKAVHILTKLFLKEFLKRDRGSILNVASIAGFLPGPLLCAYYSTKAYVLTLTKSIYGEMKAKKSNVYIGALCPGPVDTEFDRVADVKFSLKGISSEYAARYGIEKMLKRKVIILPTFGVKATAFFSRFIPLKYLAKTVYKTQRKKLYKK